mmetsp:Transcript_3808/g.9299  ORF Transcript_3808/g.9299 Transcript_3808/m.9299 type:complete len:349 (+) Transcript_3808:3551-4597(+)
MMNASSYAALYAVFVSFRQLVPDEEVRLHGVGHDVESVAFPVDDRVDRESRLRLRLLVEGRHLEPGTDRHAARVDVQRLGFVVDPHVVGDVRREGAGRKVRRAPVPHRLLQNGGGVDVGHRVPEFAVVDHAHGVVPPGPQPGQRIGRVDLQRPVKLGGLLGANLVALQKIGLGRVQVEVPARPVHGIEALLGVALVRNVSDHRLVAGVTRKPKLQELERQDRHLVNVFQRRDVEFEAGSDWFLREVPRYAEAHAVAPCVLQSARVPRHSPPVGEAHLQDFLHLERLAVVRPLNRVRLLAVAAHEGQGGRFAAAVTVHEHRHVGAFLQPLRVGVVHAAVVDVVLAPPRH